MQKLIDQVLLNLPDNSSTVSLHLAAWNIANVLGETDKAEREVNLLLVLLQAIYTILFYNTIL